MKRKLIRIERFVMQPLQNPPLCSSTSTKVLLWDFLCATVHATHDILCFHHAEHTIAENIPISVVRNCNDYRYLANVLLD